VEDAELRRRLAGSVVARLATIGSDERPHLVPICFAVVDDTLYFSVDSKPKRTRDLQRLKNIRAHPIVSILVDHYEEDWRRLWWVRADGTARIVGDAAEAARAIALLTARYSQYRRDQPTGPVVAVKITKLTGWSAS
jgi:PPOX class probable F420-dependent enzyme